MQSGSSRQGVRFVKAPQSVFSLFNSILRSFLRVSRRLCAAIQTNSSLQTGHFCIPHQQHQLHFTLCKHPLYVYHLTCIGTPGICNLRHVHTQNNVYRKLLSLKCHLCRSCSRIGSPFLDNLLGPLFSPPIVPPESPPCHETIPVNNRELPMFQKDVKRIRTSVCLRLCLISNYCQEGRVIVPKQIHLR